MPTRGELRFGRYGLAGPQGPLRAANDVIALPPKALAMLWTLAGRAGEVVTKDELLAAVWPRTAPTEGVIAACLRDLRHALDDDAKQPRYIATAHRIGYRFIAEVTSDAHSMAPDLHAPEPASPHFVGRNAELARLHAAFAKALGGQRQLVFVSGEAGIGKTTLVDAFVTRLVHSREAAHAAANATPDAAGLKLAHGQCVEHHGAGEPYLPVLEALSRLCRQAGGDRLVTLLRRYAPTWLVQLPGLLDDAEAVALQRQVAGSSAERMSREMVEAIEAIAAAEPLALVFEDMHWSDRSTVDWLAMLARRREAARLLVIVTCRLVELIVNDHPLKALKQELVMHGLGAEVPLGTLAVDAVQAYVERRLPGGGSDLAARVYRRSQGHPLFMVHVADDVEQHGAAEQAAESAVPGGVRELIEAQLARLAPAQRASLEAASVAGAEFAAASVAAALQDGPEQTERTLETLAAREQFIEARGLAEWRDGTISGRYAFGHDLYRETLYRAIGAARRAQWHARIGERLALAYGERAEDIAPVLAVHFEQARDSSRAAPCFAAAGDHALRRHGYAEALHLFGRALHHLAALPPTPGREREQLRVQIGIGTALGTTFSYCDPRVEEAYRSARELCERLGDDEQSMPLMWGQIHRRFLLGKLAEALPLAQQLLARCEAHADPALALVGHAALALVYLHMGRPEPALAHAARRPSAGEPAAPWMAFAAPDPINACASYHAIALWLRGRPDEALRQIEAACIRTADGSHVYAHALMLYRRAMVLQLRGELPQMLRAAQRAFAYSAEHGFRLPESACRIVRGWASVACGEAVDGVSEMERGLHECEQLGVLGLRPWYLALLADAQRRRGNPAAAWQATNQALDMLERTGERWCEAEVLRLRGELLLRNPALAPRIDAMSCLRRALAVAWRQRATAWALRAALDCARASTADPDARLVCRLARVCAAFGGDAPSPELVEARALVARFGGVRLSG